MKLTQLLFEASGDFSGAPSFAGGPFGFGGFRQLVKPHTPVTTVDPAEKDKLETYDDGYDSRSHLLPHEDETLRTENAVNDPARGAYSDLRGYPRMNSLADKVDFIPPDKDKARNFPEEDKDNVRIDLVPDGKDDMEPEYWGYGSLDEPYETGRTVPRRKFEETLALQGNPSINNWKTTTRQNMGKQQRSVDYSQLVEPHDWVKDLPADDWDRNKLDDPDDVLTRPGTMGTITAPRKHMPDGGHEITNETKHTKDDVETLIDTMNPYRHAGSGGTVLVGQEDFVVNLEQTLRAVAKKAVRESRRKR